MARCENMLLMFFKRTVIAIMVVPIVLWTYKIKASNENKIEESIKVIKEIKSPHKRYVLFVVGLFENEPNFKMYLQDTINNTKNFIYAYNRHIEQIWSSNDNNLAITDYGGSDFANCTIFTLGDQIKKTSINNKLKQAYNNKTISKQEYNSIYFNHHVYITCNKWLDENNMLIKIYGYGNIDSNGFTLFYKYNTNKNQFTFVKKLNFEADV